jgi:hypothetical protein
VAAQGFCDPPKRRGRAHALDEAVDPAAGLVPDLLGHRELPRHAPGVASDDLELGPEQLHVVELLPRERIR